MAAPSGRRRGVRGDRAFRKLINRMPEAIRQEMVELLDGVGDDIAAAQRAESPSSRVRAAITKRVYRATLRLKVGLIGRPINRRLFFAGILEKGRRAQTVNVTRVGRGRASRPYTMRVPAMAARPSVYSTRVRAIRGSLGGRVSKFWDGALARAAAGATDD